MLSGVYKELTIINIGCTNLFQADVVRCKTTIYFPVTSTKRCIYTTVGSRLLFLLCVNCCPAMNDTHDSALLLMHGLCAGPTEVLMNLSEMTHRITDSLKRMTDRLTHRRATTSKRPSAKDEEIRPGGLSKWDDMT